ncbi:MAG: PspC domain-containing protein, partial [Pseudomonadota bacterium]
MSSRHPKAWLGGVCATVADTLNFSTLGVRVVTVILAFIWPLLTLAAYLFGLVVHEAAHLLAASRSGAGRWRPIRE